MKKNTEKEAVFFGLVEGWIYLKYVFFLGWGGVFWVKSEAINEQENKVLDLYEHIGNFVLTCMLCSLSLYGALNNDASCLS
jgi:hypothetical protein